MKSYETCVKACSEEYVYLDKKLRERRYKFDKYIIVLEDKAPFNKGDEVRVISEEDFQKLFQALKMLKTDKTELMDQVEDLRGIINSSVPKNDLNWVQKLKNYFRGFS